MSHITYKEPKRGYSGRIPVLLDGKTVGTIRLMMGGRWAYFLKGKSTFTQAFSSLEAVKKSLEGGSNDEAAARADH